MNQPRDLLPELLLWADHKPITVEAWLAQVARSDEAMGFCAVLWPAFVTVGDMVFRAPFDHQRLAGWVRADHPREAIERALNLFSLKDYFHSGPNRKPSRATGGWRWGGRWRRCCQPSWRRTFRSCGFRRCWWTMRRMWG